MNNGEILKTAFAITRRNGYLWFFGIFAGGTAGLTFPGNFAPPGDGGDGPSADLPAIEPGVIIGVVLLALVLIVALIEFRLIAQGALIESVAAIDRGGERRFKTAWKSGMRTFWRVLGWAALLVVIALGVLIVVGAPLAVIVIGVFSATESVGVRIAVGIVVALLAIAAFVLIFVPLQIVAEVAVRDLVLREERPVAALRHGYQMFRAHLGPSVITWLIQLGIGIGMTIVLLIVGVVLAVAVAIPTIALFAAEFSAAAIVVLVVAALVLVPLFLVLLGALGTFTPSVWTLAYLRLGRAGPSDAA